MALAPLAEKSPVLYKSKILVAGRSGAGIVGCHTKKSGTRPHQRFLSQNKAQALTTSC